MFCEFFYFLSLKDFEWGYNFNRVGIFLRKMGVINFELKIELFLIIVYVLFRCNII